MGAGTGSFTSSITGLSPGTAYYVRAYATNGQGTDYGEEENFTTFNDDGETVMDYDGNVYNIIQIGSQVWMKENMKATHYADGGYIPFVEENSSWESLGYNWRAYCWSENDTAYRDIYGGLYTWAAAMNGAAGSISNPSGIQGVCPDGWHIPGDDEWKQLEMYLGMEQVDADNAGYRGTDEGTKLMEGGFSALPGGSRLPNGTFDAAGNSGNWWSATDVPFSGYAWCRTLSSTKSTVYRMYNSINYGMSVRCVANEESYATVPAVLTSVIGGITENSAWGGGNVTSDGGATVYARGVCWSTSPAPGIYDSYTTDGDEPEVSQVPLQSSCPIPHIM